jgi:hypothetical protein
MISSWAMMLVLLAGGGNDLLDYLPAKHYWQAKSVTVTTENLLAELKADPKDKATAVRRLMAIRTLGEQKDPNALPALKKLLGSKELFEDEYARRAVAAIEGRNSSPQARRTRRCRATCGSCRRTAASSSRRGSSRASPRVPTTWSRRLAA